MTMTRVVDMSDLNRADFTKKEWRTVYFKRYQQAHLTVFAEYYKRYRQSKNGKANIKRYKQSENGKAADKRYKQSEKGKANGLRCRQSENHKARQKRWSQSEKGRASITKRANKRNAIKLNAMPAWYNENEVNEIFKKSTRKTIQTGKAYAVDHIVPLQGKSVCGLHVQGNLRVILASTNHKKNNHFTPDIEQLVLRLMARDQAA
jgi:hypothetical protein